MFVLLLLMTWIASTYGSGHCLPIKKAKLKQLFKSGACKKLSESVCIASTDCNWFIEHGGIVYAADKRSQQTLSYEPKKTRQKAPKKATATKSKTKIKSFPFGITRIDVAKKTMINFIPMYSTFAKYIKSNPDIAKQVHAEHQLKSSSKHTTSKTMPSKHLKTPSLIKHKTKEVITPKTLPLIKKKKRMIKHTPLIQQTPPKIAAHRRLFAYDRRKGLTPQDIADYGHYKAIGGVWEYGRPRVQTDMAEFGDRDWRDEGSGFLVGKKWALTAAHTLWNGQWPYDIDYYGFFPGYTGHGNVRSREGELGDDSRPDREADEYAWDNYQYKFERVWMPTAWVAIIKEGLDDETEWQYDWAVIELENEVDIEEQYLFEMKYMIDLRSIEEDDERMWKAGYPIEWMYNMVSTKEDKSIFGKFSWKYELMYFKDAISNGESGGPIVFNDNVYGIQRGYTPNKEYTVGVGLSVPRRTTICWVTDENAKGCAINKEEIDMEAYQVIAGFADEHGRPKQKEVDIETFADIDFEEMEQNSNVNIPRPQQGYVGEMEEHSDVNMPPPQQGYVGEISKANQIAYDHYDDMTEYDKQNSRQNANLFESDISPGIAIKHLLFVTDIIIILIICCLITLITYICGVGTGYIVLNTMVEGFVINHKNNHVENIENQQQRI